MKYIILGFTLFFIFSNHILLSQSGSNGIPTHGLWPRPEIVPPPTNTDDVENPVIWLNGTWFINTNPGKEYWNEKIDPKDWKEVIAPASDKYLNIKNISVVNEYKAIISL